MSAVKEYSGAVVTFSANAVKSLKALIINLRPIQDLHGYDNPWPAGGGVSKCPSFANGTHTMTNGLTVTIQDGEITINGTASGSGYYEEAIESTVMPADAYVSFNNPVGTYNMAYAFINGNTQIASTSTAPANATKQPTGLSGATVNKLRIFCNAGTYDNFKMSPIVHDGSTPQAWQPYANICPITGWTGANVYVSPTQDVADATTYPVTWQTEAGTIYGGTVDIVSGVLTVDRASVDLGTKSWAPSTLAGYTRFWTTITGIAQISAPNIVAPMLCSNYPTKTANQTYQGTTGVSLQQNSTQIYIYDPQAESMTGDEFKAAMSGVQLCYELATPVTYQLTPQEVQTLVGRNYVWSDGGEVTVRV